MMDVDAELQKMEALFVRRKPDGYINASVLCRAFGKRWHDYVLLDHMSYSFHEYLQSLQEEFWVEDAEEFVQAVGDELWVHEYIAISLAQWLSTAFAVRVLEKFADAKWGGAPTTAQLCEVVKPRVSN